MEAVSHSWRGAAEGRHRLGLPQRLYIIMRELGHCAQR